MNLLRTALDEEDRTNIHASTRHTLNQLYETTFHIYEKARTVGAKPSNVEPC